MNRVNRAISPRNVVSALAARKSHVPLRDSKLTRSQSMPNKPNEPNDWGISLVFFGTFGTWNLLSLLPRQDLGRFYWWQLPHCFAGLREPSLWACHGPQSCAKLLGSSASQCAAFQVGETLNTLEFASRAMRVEAEDSITVLSGYVWMDYCRVRIYSCLLAAP